jgi:hypothetical protein
LAEVAVQVEPVSASNSLIIGKNTGNFVKSGFSLENGGHLTGDFRCLQPYSPPNATGNLEAQIWEFFARNSDLNSASAHSPAMSV